MSKSATIVVRVPPDLVTAAQAATGLKKGPAVAERLRVADGLAERVAVLERAVAALQEVRR